MKNVVFCAVLFAVASAYAENGVDGAFVQETQCNSCSAPHEFRHKVIRSADPCNAWKRPGWRDGPGAIITPELQDGNASHNLSPAEIIYYSVQENSSPDLGFVINPVLVLTYLENAELLRQGMFCGDFEYKLLKAVGYDKDRIKYNGFYPQVVSSTYQWRLYQERRMSFSAAQKLYPFLSINSFRAAYAKNARLMNQIAGTNFRVYPVSQGYYRDFFDFVGIGQIQEFLQRKKSPLQNWNLFRQRPVQGSEVDYSNTKAYCE